MALGFANSKGGAVKDRADGYQITEGKNTVRMVGDLLARYVYWVKGANDKNIPLECLAFNRQTEKFDNKEKDWVKEYYPDLKCGWAYVIQAIDPKDGKLKIWNLKKKLTEEIMGIANDEDAGLGDPTDPVIGWDVVFTKKKTGPLPINVSYSLNQLSLKKRPLTEAELAIIAELKPMDEVFVRPTPEQQKEFLDKLKNGSTESIEEDVSEEFETK